jgi:hypothetical protein
MFLSTEICNNTKEIRWTLKISDLRLGRSCGVLAEAEKMGKKINF